MTFKLTPGKVPNGGVLLLGISYQREGDLYETRGMTSPKVFTYAALKTGGLWYLTGSGKVPTAAGWPAVERWLARDGRVVEWVTALLNNGTKIYDRTDPPTSSSES